MREEKDTEVQSEVEAQKFRVRPQSEEKTDVSVSFRKPSADLSEQFSVDLKMDSTVEENIVIEKDVVSSAESETFVIPKATKTLPSKHGDELAEDASFVSTTTTEQLIESDKATESVTKPLELGTVEQPVESLLSESLSETVTVTEVQETTVEKPKEDKVPIVEDVPEHDTATPSETTVFEEVVRK